MTLLVLACPHHPLAILALLLQVLMQRAAFNLANAHDGGHGGGGGPGGSQLPAALQAAAGGLGLGPGPAGPPGNVDPNLIAQLLLLTQSGN